MLESMFRNTVCSVAVNMGGIFGLVEAVGLFIRCPGLSGRTAVTSSSTSCCCSLALRVLVAVGIETDWLADKTLQLLLLLGLDKPSRYFSFLSLPIVFLQCSPSIQNILHLGELKSLKRSRARAACVRRAGAAPACRV